MPYQRPTLTELRQQVAADITSQIAGADGLLRFSNLNVIGTVIAGLANMHYGYQDWQSMQSVPWTCVQEFLEGWAALVGITRQSAAAAGGTVVFTGNNGLTIPIGATMVRGDGETYTVTVAGTMSGGTCTVTVVDAATGSQGNSASGTILTLGNTIAGINSTGTANVITGGTDVETDTSLRARMLERFQNPPQGGAQNDYITWALAVAGVTRAWCAPNGQGVGTVEVFFMMDVAEEAFNGFPQGSNGTATGETRDTNATGDQLAVANYIYPRQPVTALVYAVAPTAAPQNFTIHGLLPNTTAMKAAVSAAISDVFLREGAAAAPGGTGGTVYLADIEAGINAVAGIIDFIIISPTADVVTALGALPTLGTITWT